MEGGGIHGLRSPLVGRTSVQRTLAIHPEFPPDTHRCARPREAAFAGAPLADVGAELFPCATAQAGRGRHRDVGCNPAELEGDPVRAGEILVPGLRDCVGQQHLATRLTRALVAGYMERTRVKRLLLDSFPGFATLSGAARGITYQDKSTIARSALVVIGSSPSYNGPDRSQSEQNAVKEFIKNTLIGGLLFLLPFGIALFVLGYVLQIAASLGRAILGAIHPGGEPSVAGIGVVTLASVIAVVLIAFVSGLVARTGLGARVRRVFETSVLESIPQYQLIRSMAEGLAQVETTTGAVPAIVSIEGGWQICYLLERLENDWVAVFIPQAPTPMAGTVMYFPAERVRRLGISMVQTMAIVKRIGVGSAAALRGTDLTLPDAAL